MAQGYDDVWVTSGCDRGGKRGHLRGSTQSHPGLPHAKWTRSEHSFPMAGGVKLTHGALGEPLLSLLKSHRAVLEG